MAGVQVPEKIDQNKENFKDTSLISQSKAIWSISEEN